MDGLLIFCCFSLALRFYDPTLSRTSFRTSQIRMRAVAPFLSLALSSFSLSLSLPQLTNYGALIFETDGRIGWLCCLLPLLLLLLLHPIEPVHQFIFPLHLRPQSEY